MRRSPISIIIGCLLVILGACDPGEKTPHFVAMPTLLVLPSLTPTDTPVPTPTLTLSPTLTRTPRPTPTETHTPEPTPIAFVELVIAVQPIPAGAVIPPEAVQLYPWPEASDPFTAVTSLDEVVGKVALAEIGCYEPVLRGVLANRTLGSGYPPLPGTCAALPNPPLEIMFVDVAVAAQYIPAGTRISPEMITIRAWPELLAPDDAARSFVEVVGAVAQSDILQEQPVRSGKVRREDP